MACGGCPCAATRGENNIVISTVTAILSDLCDIVCKYKIFLRICKKMVSGNALKKAASHEGRGLLPYDLSERGCSSVISVCRFSVSCCRCV